MNEKLKFSWGHIIAFIAVIITSYIAFMGFTYLSDGNFTLAIILMAVTDILFILFFIGAQQMKASGENIRKKIVWERIFFFGAPVVFIAGMIAMSHFWTVHSREDEVVEGFTNAINGSKQMFNDYLEYSQNRIDKYDNTLADVIHNRFASPETYSAAGFKDINNEKLADLQRENMVEVLKLQLLSPNFTALQDTAMAWIDDANQGASSWNVFLLGNTREIKAALLNWEEQLRAFTDYKLTNEEIIESVEPFTSDAARKAVDGINSLKDVFTSQAFPTWQAILFALVLYLMLIFPYLIQERHSKSWYRLIGNENSKSPQKHKNKHRNTGDSQDENQTKIIGEQEGTAFTSSDSNDVDDYKIF